MRIKSEIMSTLENMGYEVDHKMLRLPEKVPLLMNYDHKKVLGMSKIKKEGKKVFAIADIRDKDIIEKIRKGEWRIGAGLTFDKHAKKGKKYHIEGAELVETSVVPVPLNPKNDPKRPHEEYVKRD